MNVTRARGDLPNRALELVQSLQQRFVAGLEAATGSGERFEPVEWLRDEGRHGGGRRLAIGSTPHFDRASVNVSQVHYDDQPEKKLGSATALSTIIHPAHPRVPSVHMHISWTQMRDGTGGWRLMADLNPAIPDPESTAAFEAALARGAGDLLADGKAQGDRYFHIPALGRHRGVSHFYVEGYATEDFEQDAKLAADFGETMIDAYVAIFGDALSKVTSPTDDEKRRQLEYHSVYFFQVLTLDRGTTSGLLVHDQNDVGTLGSLPSLVDRACLERWRGQVPQPQGELVDGLMAALPDASPSPVTTEAKAALAKVVREHYRAHPEALRLQASGDQIPSTVANHTQ